MKTRYCINCGMPIPRKAKICPECGFSLEAFGRQKNPPQSVQPHMNRSSRRTQQTKNQNAWLYGVGFLIVFFAVMFVIMHVPRELENARSRHQENKLDEERDATTTRPELSIPEMSISEFTYPKIQFPEPPAAAFAVEGYELETNLMGETVLYVNINYTNKAETEQCFLTSFRISVQQDGETCKQTAGNPTRENHLMEYVQPDETALVSEAFVINTEKETTVSVSVFFGGDKYLEEIILPHTDGTVSVGE